MNMSYCQFENTLRALRQIKTTLEENTFEEVTRFMYQEERAAFDELPVILSSILELHEECLAGGRFEMDGREV